MTDSLLMFFCLFGGMTTFNSSANMVLYFAIFVSLSWLMLHFCKFWEHSCLATRNSLLAFVRFGLASSLGPRLHPPIKIRTVCYIYVLLLHMWFLVSKKLYVTKWHIMAVHSNGHAITFLPRACSFFYLFSSPNLNGRRLDVYHTLTHGVAAVRI